jgi:SAM-dependent methyltransferase
VAGRGNMSDIRKQRANSSMSGLISSKDIFLSRVRTDELDSVRRWLPPGSLVLELGTGNGIQAGQLTKRGCRVVGIDVAPASNLVAAIYDGLNIPMAGSSVDRVFSSNCLEHVVSLDELLLETHRVLKPDGLAVHVVPSTSWRAVSFIGCYFAALRRTTRSRTSLPENHSSFHSANMRAPKPRISLFPPAHGTARSALHELVSFSRRRWKRKFLDAGFKILLETSSGLLYSGNYLLPHLDFRWRKVASRFLGSSCHVFVLAPRSGS